MKTDSCRSCDAVIIGAITRKGKWMPVDAEPREDGNLELTEGEPLPGVRVVKKGDPINGLRYVSHFVTCPNANFHRQRC